MIEFIPENGGCSRIRTYDPLIKSQLLYQLSYAPAPEGQGPGEGAEHTRNCFDGKPRSPRRFPAASPPPP